MRTRIDRAFKTVAAALTFALLAATPVLADPSTPVATPVVKSSAGFERKLDAKKTQLEKFKAQLDELDRELALSAEEYNLASQKLAETKSHLAATETELARVREDYDGRVTDLGDRAETMYREGDEGIVSIVLSSTSVNDFVNRMRFLQIVSERDSIALRQLGYQKGEMEKAAQDLKRSSAEAEALEFDLRARKIEVELRVEERQTMLKTAQADLAKLLAEEAERRKAEQSKLVFDLRTGDTGIVVEPFSPVETALAYHGIPYLWAGEDPRKGFDCSGLMLYVFKQHGVKLPHYSGSQFMMGDKVANSDLKPGDAVFFGSPVHHVGMYVGGGYFIHAPRTGDFVKLSKLAERRDFVGARRYPWQPRVGAPLGVTEPRTRPTVPLTTP